MEVSTKHLELTGQQQDVSGIDLGCPEASARAVTLYRRMCLLDLI
jgi:hypothetical protein